MQSSNGVWIGIDGGGTKTTAALCTAKGEILAAATSDASNPLSRPWSHVEQTLRQLIEGLLLTSGRQKDEVEAIVFGLAGADRDEVKELIASAFGGEFGGKLVLDNDAATALYAGTWGEPGVVLIAGTGSIAYGVSRDEKRCRVGGWGYLLGDEGSGFSLGRDALIACLRHYDGRGPKTLLTELLLRHYGASDPSQLIHLVYSAENQRKQISELSRVLLAAAEQGDETACRLVEQAAEALVELASTCLAKLAEPLPVVLAGGLLASGNPLQRQVKARLSTMAAVVSPSVPPVAGALVLALKSRGLAVDEARKERIMCSWPKHGKG
ncbi:N-acetylglucosamine kinase [Brevibacillus sp. B_LB10_24]|uniref:N-acetylglucosamine kinase n=1 Tax=Brevibacillus sp. B_LB10_24 TaxID=3380645 RepID=UPI0038B919E5